MGYMVVSINGGTPIAELFFFNGKNQSKMDDLGVPPFRKPPYMAMNTYKYHFRGNIHEHQLFWRELQGCKVLTHPRIYT